MLRSAIGLADAGGIDALTMRALAAKLGVEAMSLYHHVASKEDILDGMIDLIFEEIGLPPDGLDWRAAWRVRAVSARQVLLRHRWAVGLMDSRTALGPATLRHHDTMIGILRSAGFPMARVAHAGPLMDAYVFGFVLQEKTLPGSAPADVEAMTRAMLDQLPAEEYPNLHAFAREHVLRPGYSFAAEFEFGLDLLLDGLARSG